MNPTRWICGHNIAGYLPETDEPPYPYETFDDAKRSLIDEIERCADDTDEGEDYAEALTAMAEDLNLVSEGDWLDYVTYRSGSQAWWIQATTDYDPQELDQ